MDLAHFQRSAGYLSTPSEKVTLSNTSRKILEQAPHFCCNSPFRQINQAPFNSAWSPMISRPAIIHAHPHLRNPLLHYPSSCYPNPEFTVIHSVTNVKIVLYHYHQVILCIIILLRQVPLTHGIIRLKKTHCLFRRKQSYAFQQEKTRGAAFRNRLISLPVLFYRRSRLTFGQFSGVSRGFLLSFSGCTCNAAFVAK